jgi:hypothetical protein
MKTKIKLGDYVEDTITGYEGIVTGITHWLNGCARVGIQSKENRSNETGLPVDIYWVDETTIKIKKVQVHKSTQKENGGPSLISGRNQDPKF